MQTILYNEHLKASGKMVNFAGFMLPLDYGSQIKEALAVRQAAGIFDVSHMAIWDITGPEATVFLAYLLANDINLLVPNQALYSCMLNNHGGIIDDLICYKISAIQYRIVSNAATKEKVYAFLKKISKNFNLELVLRNDLAIIALQGPRAVEILLGSLPLLREGRALRGNDGLANIKPFHFQFFGDTQIARTGYTGEDGFEIIIPQNAAEDLWANLVQHAQPCGLGARDILRLEAGLNLYGQDMTEDTTPYESNLAWTVKISADRDFIGKTSLLAKKDQTQQILTGIILEDRGVLRHDQVLSSGASGVITSAVFSPVLNKSIGLVRIKKTPNTEVTVTIRDKILAARLVKPPFIRKGKILINTTVIK